MPAFGDDAMTKVLSFIFPSIFHRFFFFNCQVSRHTQPSLSINHVNINVILYILLLNRWKQAHSLLCIPQVPPNILYM